METPASYEARAAPPPYPAGVETRHGEAIEAPANERAGLG